MTPKSVAIISANGAVATGAATCGCSLPADANCYWFVSGFEVTSGGATAGSIINATLSGLLGGTITYKVAVPSGVTLSATPLVVEFPSALAGAAVNTAVSLILDAPGSGNTGASVTLHGYKGQRQLSS